MKGAYPAMGPWRWVSRVLAVAAALVIVAVTGCVGKTKAPGAPPAAVYPTEWPEAIASFREQLGPLEAPFADMRRSYCLLVWASLWSDENLMRGLLDERIYDMDENKWVSREEFLAPVKSRQPLGLSQEQCAMLFWDRTSGAKLAFFDAKRVKELKLASPPGMGQGDYLLGAAPAETEPQYFFFTDRGGHYLIYAVGQGQPRYGGGSGGQ